MQRLLVSKQMPDIPPCPPLLANILRKCFRHRASEPPGRKPRGCYRLGDAASISAGQLHFRQELSDSNCKS